MADYERFARRAISVVCVKCDPIQVEALDAVRDRWRADDGNPFITRSDVVRSFIDWGLTRERAGQ